MDEAGVTQGPAPRSRLLSGMFDDKEICSNSQGFSIPLASSIYECPQHGQFRIYISGAVKRCLSLDNRPGRK